MNVTEAGDTFDCDCGFSWRVGQSGSHSCGDGLRKQIAELKAQRDALAAENAELLDFDIDEFRESGPYQPDDAILGKLKTPATDAYLNSLRAEGVDMFAELHDATAEKYRSESPGCYGEQLHQHASSEAVKFAAQLRAGKDGE